MFVSFVLLYGKQILPLIACLPYVKNLPFILHVNLIPTLPFIWILFLPILKVKTVRFKLTMLMAQGHRTIKG